MKLLVCERCGGDEFTEQEGYRICRYCKSRFQITNEDITKVSTTISLNEDVVRLLEKCRTDPKNARRYAGLVLDIDPTNQEALKFYKK